MRRTAIKLFFVVLVACISLDSLPNSVGLYGAPRACLSAVVNRMGLWQGAWTMFAPNPSVNHLWLSADIYDSSGNQIEAWNSPYWQNVSAWEKFYGFRHMNYFTRMCSPLHRKPAQDFANYLAISKENEETGPLIVELFANSLELVSPVDGSMPPHEELVWVTESRQLNDPWTDANLEMYPVPEEIMWGGGQ